MSTYTHPRPRGALQAVRQLVWFVLVSAAAFLVPYLGVSVLDLQHDVFYLVYFAVTIALLAGYVRVEQVDVAEAPLPPLAVEPGHRSRPRRLARDQRLQHRGCDGTAARCLFRLRAALAASATA